MTKQEKCAFLIFIIVGWVSLGKDIATAQTASALVLEKSGATNPEVQPYTEILVGKTISLSPETRLTFQHYHTCHTVTVAGGAINFEAKAYFIKGGQKKKETQTPCPKKVTLKAGGEAGGVLMRSMMSRNLLTLSPHPTFVLVGKHAHHFAFVRVSQEGKEVLKSRLEGPRFQWPTEAISLSADAEYELALIPAVAGALPVKKKFRVTNTPSGQTIKGLVLIRVD